MNRESRLVCCTPDFGDDWRWLEHRIAAPNLRWEFWGAKPRNFFERHIHRPNLSRIRACWQCVRSLRTSPPDLFASHDPRVTFWCARFIQQRGLSVRHVAFSFNFAGLPGKAMRRRMSEAYESVDRFVTYSTMERRLYADFFGIPDTKIDTVLWSVGVPEVAHPEKPLVPGEYVCALGGNARDYRTLAAAVAKLPEISLVLVARAHNLVGLELSPNARVFQEIPTGEAMNVLYHSRFMVLPLAGSEVPCGHVTLVAAMHLGKAFVITDSSGVNDYVQDGHNAITCEPRCAESLAAAIRSLWQDPDRCALLAANGREFARKNCSEEHAAEYLGKLLQHYGLIGAPLR
jgi:glycosyltransferase involved in cell wall biosynthesis